MGQCFSVSQPVWRYYCRLVVELLEVCTCNLLATWSSKMSTSIVMLLSPVKKSKCLPHWGGDLNTLTCTYEHIRDSCQDFMSSIKG